MLESLREMEDPGGPSLAADPPESDSPERLPARLERYGKARSRAIEMQEHCKAQGETKLYDKLSHCGNWLLFHHYYTVNKVRLVGATFCKKHLVCPLCAIRRGAKQLTAYLDRFRVIQSNHGPLKASMVCFTVKNGPDLLERFEHLMASLKILNQRRRDCKRGGRSRSEWSKVLGLVGTYEVTRNQDTHEWHPHCHIIILHKEEISELKLRQEWFQITGDSHQIDLEELRHPDDPAKDFIEVFKYAVKFSELTVEDNLQAFQVLNKRRLIFSAGLFWGVEVPEDLTEEPLEDLPFIKLFYRFLPGSGYNLVDISSIPVSS